MHDFTRRAKNQILIDRAEKLKKIKEQNDEIQREMDEATIDTTPKDNRRRMTVAERDARDNFVKYFKSVVTKDGEGSKSRMQYSLSDQI